MPHSVTASVGAAPITLETGKLARLADGAVTLRYGDTILLVTSVSATSIKEGQDWFPLTVDYREKAASVGKIPGGYFRREGRPSEKEILTCRMTDRPLRPLFPKGYLYDTQIIATLLSADGENDPDILCINGASAALCVSDIPFAGPIGAVRVGRVDGQFVANPTHSQREHSDLNLVYAGTAEEVIMIEGEGSEIPEDAFIEALRFAQTQVRLMVEAQRQLAAMANKTKRVMPLFAVRDALMDIAYSVAGDRIEAAIYNASKSERNKAVSALKAEVKAAILAQHPDALPFEVSQAFESLQKKAFRRSILEQGKRADGRGLADLRQLGGEVGLLPRSHGSALFMRGETQALALATLASANESQNLDAYTGGESEKSFILHYNFPPFSVNETGRTGSPGRREIGHGALAERSIEPVIPSKADFPYAIRISSEIMESNGSTSMASVCAGILALMDAGVPIKTPVAGISVGLVTEYNDDPGTAGRQMTRYAMLTDIIGSEDHYGDMDFKLCGTDTGVTGFQLDLKLPGISLDLLAEAVGRAKESRTRILEVMHGIMAAPRTELSQYAPRIETVRVNPEKIGLIIGPGGKTIKSIVAETGCEINIEDDGSINIYSNNGDAMARAKQIITGMVKEIEVGQMYDGRVVSVKEFGCFVEVLPGKEGLVHISELAEARVNRTEDVVRVGDIIPVKCIGVDEKGRVKFSRRAAMRDRDAAARGEGGEGGGNGGSEGDLRDVPYGDQAAPAGARGGDRGDRGGNGGGGGFRDRGDRGPRR